MNNEGHKLNDAEKAEGSEERSTTAVPALNLSRRRLVRGAVAVAPLVLTLRSGALAAASCTGAKALSATVDNTGGPNQGGQITLNGGSAQAGDYCVTAVQQNNCPDQKILGGTVDSQPITGPNLRCGTVKNAQNVAILSGLAAQSLTGAV